MSARWRSRRAIKAVFTQHLTYVPEVPFSIDSDTFIASAGVREHWLPACSAGAVFDMIYTHLERWPDDHGRMQHWIGNAFLYHFPGDEGDVFRSWIWPPPLFREMNK